MKELVAKNGKQLEMCLKTLYAEHIPFLVDIRFTDKEKIVYVVSVDVDDKTIEKLKFKYKVMIG